APASLDVPPDLVHQPRALGPVDPPPQLVAAAHLSPAGHERSRDPRAARGVRVLVGEDLDTARPGGVDAHRRGVRESPRRLAERLHVTHDPRQAALLGDADHFLDRSHEADRVITLVADVARIDAAVTAGGARQRDDLLRFRVAAGRVIQTA